ncbi:MAG: 5'(3')-deoxyribonucleotidase [Galbibacter orientalis]|uniref:5' nucleotidase, NT5C type n=1 Tax=Galbibacter orientalis TaxID=453852 RepID=UPI00300350D1
MAQKRLLVDMDGVLADTYQQFFRLESNITGKKIEREDVIGVSEADAFPNYLSYIHKAGFFRDAPVIENAIEVMKKLNNVYDIFIVSSAMEFPNSLREKYDWLQEHFPFLHWKQIILCGSKIPVQGDILIDDHFKNLDYFKKTTLLYTQPHNMGRDKGHQRVNNWKEIESILL